MHLRKLTIWSESWPRKEILQSKKAWLWKPTADTAGLRFSTIQRQRNPADTTMPPCLQLRVWSWNAGSEGCSRWRWMALLHMTGDCHLYIQELEARGTGIQGGHHQSSELKGIWWLLHAHTTVDCIPGQEPSQSAENSLQVGHIQTHKHTTP